MQRLNIKLKRNAKDMENLVLQYLFHSDLEYQYFLKLNLEFIKTVFITRNSIVSSLFYQSGKVVSHTQTHMKQLKKKLNHDESDI